MPDGVITIKELKETEESLLWKEGLVLKNTISDLFFNPKRDGKFSLVNLEDAPVFSELICKIYYGGINIFAMVTELRTGVSFNVIRLKDIKEELK